MKMKKAPIYIVGTGIDAADMSPRALELIGRADVLAGGRRLLDRFAAEHDFFSARIASSNLWSKPW